MSENTLFNECLACKMKFETRQQLENHVKKFCVGSDYGSQNKLEEKYQRELLNLKKSNVPGAREIIETGRPPQGQQQKNQLSLESMKDQIKQQDDEFKRLNRMAQKRREDEMEDELNKLKNDRQQIKMKRDDDRQAFEELLHEVEQKKEKEIRARIEKDEIRRALMDLEKAKLTAIEQERKRELEKLIAEREALRMKENELIKDIESMEQNTRMLDQMRQEEVSKINNVIEGMQLKQKNNTKLNEDLIQERSDNVAKLKLKREQLEGERLRIMDNLDKLRNGDLKAAQRGGTMNLVANAKNILGDMKQMENFNAKLHDGRFVEQQQRINQLKQQKPEFMPFDGDEAYGQRATVGQQAVDMYRSRNPQTQGELQAFRQGIEQHANSMMDQSLSQSVNMSQVKRQPSSQVNRAPATRLQPQQTIQSFPDVNQQLQQQQQQQQQIEVLKNAWGVPIPQFQNNQFQMLPQQQQPQVPQFLNNPMMQYNQFAQPQMMPAYNPIMQQQSQQQGPTAFGQFALNQLALNQEGKKMKDPWSIFNRKNEFFLMNEVRGVDLTEEERVLMSLQAQEIDSLRVISRIPVGTELYRFKVEQYKELSTMRAEIEKIVQEQRLQDARREFEMERREDDRQWENEKWVDDNKKFIIENRLRKDNTQKRQQMQQYNQSEGFVVHWDYTLGLPRRSNYSQVVFGVYNGQQVICQPRLVEPRESETENQNHNRCIFGDAHQVFEVPAHPDTLMIMEVQIPFSKRVEDNVGRTETYGWTQVDLFDHNKQLKRGKFKCPVYYGPTSPEITVEEIQNLEPIPNCWVYFRIGYPNDKDYGEVKTIYPEQTQHEYIVPYIHLRGLFGKREKVKNMRGMEESYETRYGGRGYKMIEEIIEESQLMGQGAGGKSNMEEYEITGQPPPMQKYGVRQEEPPIEDDGKQQGLRLIIYRVDNHQARSHLRVMAGLFEEGNLVLDANGLPVAFNTSIHNPLDQKNRQVLQNEQYIIPLHKPNVEYDGMNNKASGQDIVFQEEYRVFRNLYAMTKKNKKDLYIGLQVVEKPEPVELQESILNETQKNYAGLEFDLKGWQFLKLTQEDGSLLTGRFKMKLFKPPLRRPPIDPTKVQEMDEVIDFALHKFSYTEKDIEEFKKQMKNKHKKPKLEEIKDIPLDNSPYIPNFQQQWINEQFERRHGIDFYIDGLRFLPDKVTACKMYMEVYNRRYEKLFEAETAAPDLNSMAYNPTFYFRRELRKEKFDPTAIALITVVTVDKSTNDNRIVGYAAINLFLNPGTKSQPEDSNEDNYVVYSGAYQIPLFSQQLDRTPPFDMKKIYSHERSPCCTVLVRMYKAPLSEDGKRALSIKEFPSLKDQIARNIMRPRPQYGAGAYNTELAPITESENELFAQRTIRPDISVREAAYLLIKGEQINRQYKDNEIINYLDNRISLTHDTFMIDMMYFAKYRPQAGFKLTVDGLHNVVNQSHMYVVFYSLSQPGTFYLEPRDVTQGHMCSNYDFDSKINTPEYDDAWFKFKENANRYQNIILDIKSVPFSKPDGAISDVGWTILPVFSPDNYVMSNCYQLPVFRGSVPRAVIEDIKKQDTWDYLRDQVTNNKVFYLKNMSIIVRLVDAQREGHFNKRMDCDRLQYKYLPQGERIKQWSYNPAVVLDQMSMKTIKSLIPFKDNPAAFNRKVTEYFANSYGLTQYLGS
ncbi:unnamed protein product [Paramecium pentaurelia]|uniref:Uncharacterized protein n=1 Tax=Paramecium pentaurelia TaxID=43138 RepID=A0A8S1XYX7_9CILI|nr:unnamed protein product [Paramecium pentaurelia]